MSVNASVLYSEHVEKQVCKEGFFYMNSVILRTNDSSRYLISNGNFPNWIKILLGAVV